MADLASLVELVKTGGLALALTVIVIGGWRRWYVWGWTYDAQQKQNDKQQEALARDRDGWRTIAERGTSDVKSMVEWAQDRAKEAKE